MLGYRVLGFGVFCLCVKSLGKQEASSAIRLKARHTMKPLEIGNSDRKNKPCPPEI